MVVQVLSPEFINPRGRTQHLSWLHLRRFVLAHTFFLPRSLKVAALPSSTSPGHPSLASSVNWMGVQSASFPMSVIKKLDKTGPGINPCGTSLVTSLQFIFVSCNINHH